MLIEPAIAVLASTPEVMRSMLASLPDELVAAPDSDGWSARDVVGHHASRQEPAIVGRVRAILDRPGGPIPDVPASLMNREPFRARPFDVLLAEFAAGRAEAVALLDELTPEQMSWRGTHSGLGELSISEVIHHVAYHDLVHIAQAAHLAARPLEELRGGMRRFR